MYVNKLQELCEKDNITITSLSKKLGIDRSTTGKYISGYLPIPLTHLNSLCNYFEISLDYVFGLNGSINYKFINKDIDNDKFSKRLSELRKDKNMVQAEIAKALNCARSAISDYENGKRTISTSHLFAICKSYNISADYLLGKTNSPKYLK